VTGKIVYCIFQSKAESNTNQVMVPIY